MVGSSLSALYSWPYAAAGVFVDDELPEPAYCVNAPCIDIDTPSFVYA